MIFIQKISYYICPKTKEKFPYWHSCNDCEYFSMVIIDDETVACEYQEGDE